MYINSMNSSEATPKKDKIKTIEWLSDHFPAAFFSQAKQVKPLKIGIFDDIIEFYERLDVPPYSKTQIREALNYYSGSPAYLSSQKVHAARVDLYGNEVDEVTEEQAKYAQQKFQQRFGSKKNKSVS